MTTLALAGIVKRYPGVTALDCLDLAEVEAVEHVGAAEDDSGLALDGGGARKFGVVGIVS